MCSQHHLLQTKGEGRRKESGFESAVKVRSSVSLSWWSAPVLPVCVPEARPPGWGCVPGWLRWDTLPSTAPPHSRAVYSSNGAVKRDSDRGFSQWFYIFQNSWPSSGDSFSASHRYMISVVCFVMQASLEKSRNLSNYSISRCIIILCSGNSSESLNSCVNFHYNQNDTVESFLSSGYQNEAKKSLSS